MSGATGNPPTPNIRIGRTPAAGGQSGKLWRSQGAHLPRPFSVRGWMGLPLRGAFDSNRLGPSTFADSAYSTSTYSNPDRRQTPLEAETIPQRARHRTPFDRFQSGKLVRVRVACGAIVPVLQLKALACCQFWLSCTFSGRVRAFSRPLPLAGEGRSRERTYVLGASIARFDPSEGPDARDVIPSKPGWVTIPEASTPCARSSGGGFGPCLALSAPSGPTERWELPLKVQESPNSCGDRHCYEST